MKLVTAIYQCTKLQHPLRYFYRPFSPGIKSEWTKIGNSGELGDLRNGVLDGLYSTRARSSDNGKLDRTMLVVGSCCSSRTRGTLVSGSSSITERSSPSFHNKKHRNRSQHSEWFLELIIWTNLEAQGIKEEYQSSGFSGEGKEIIFKILTLHRFFLPQLASLKIWRNCRF